MVYCVTQITRKEPHINLQTGSQITPGESPKQRLTQRNEKAKAIQEDLLSYIQNHTLQQTAQHFSVSETTVAKEAARAIKRGDITGETLLSSERVGVIEEHIYMVNTTSIKRLIEGSTFTEAEIRIVKAMIEKRGMDECL